MQNLAVLDAKNQLGPSPAHGAYGHSPHKRALQQASRRKRDVHNGRLQSRRQRGWRGERDACLGFRTSVDVVLVGPAARRLEGELDFLSWVRFALYRERTGTIVFIQPQELSDVDSRNSFVSDFEQIFVVLVLGVVAHVC
jgi:hypothetical protein